MEHPIKRLLLLDQCGQGLEGVSSDPWIDQETECESEKHMKYSRNMHCSPSIEISTDKTDVSVLTRV